ncbi:amidase [Melittangium boletus]|uniref:Aspartyl-tRNA(Asn) amidotransferase subunit A n=1 Tax=Melittangium boletus DSM 14713 TaxID=1294270 RepID=A0A250IM73_9BACT|nr:amidase [Melittangium boletus]ATB32849.1 Aspartyl-tRNA(Asn) amidotransferase subunit A [Melittangium boletus DSM 14713]
MQELAFLPTHQMAQRVLSREVSSVELLDAHLGQVARNNVRLNALVTLDEGRARARAREADAALARGEVWGPLHGVPLTIKDAFETTGLRTTSGFDRLARHMPERDATVVARLKAAGAVIVGKTNMPRLALDTQTHNTVFGRTNNPWDVERTCGGSSGGGAVAVAAGMSSLEVGSDIGGSIRIPSHFCGVFGLKPTDGRIPLSGHIPGMPGSPRGVRHQGVAGPLARTVEDLRLALRLLSGPDGQDTEMPPIPFQDVPRRELKRYRFLWTDDFGGMPVSAETRSALAGLARTLEDAGCVVERGTPELDFEQVWLTWGQLLGAEVGSEMPAAARLMTALHFRSMRGDSSINRGIMRGLWGRMSDYTQALSMRDQLMAKVESFLSGWDAWLCPVTMSPAFTHRPSGDWLEVDARRVQYMEGTAGLPILFNVTGHPAVAMPLPRASSGCLPLGVQVVGRRWGDEALLSVAEALTDVTGPFQRPPGV